MILTAMVVTVAPARERGLKSADVRERRNEVGRSREGAWIEMFSIAVASSSISVAPARERGLKSSWVATDTHISKSLPRGSVD